MSRIKMMFGEVVEEPLTDEYIKKNIDDVSSDSREVLIEKLHDYIRAYVSLTDVFVLISRACEGELKEWRKPDTNECGLPKRVKLAIGLLFQGRAEFAEEIMEYVTDYEKEFDK